MALLFAQHPNAFTELDFRNAFELLTATILSAQSTDRGVNLATPALFAKYPDAAALAKADPADVEVLIKTTGFFRQKAKAIMGMAAALVRDHGGQVPADMDALTQLTGVGRKTANVVLGHALGIPGMPVDRHVLRVANRIGIAHAATPEEVETQLCAAMPREKWTLTSDTLILHGRRICRPHPLCEQCAVVEHCDFAREWGRTAGEATELAAADTGAARKKAATKAARSGALSGAAASRGATPRRELKQDVASGRAPAKARAGSKPAATASRTKRPALSHAGHPASSRSTSRKAR